MNVLSKKISAKFFAILTWSLFVAMLLTDQHVSPEVLESWYYRGGWRAVIMLCCIGWMRFDSAERGQADPKNYYPLLLIPELMVPLYIIRRRGWRQFLVWLLKFALFLFSAITTGIAIDSISRALLN